MEPDRRSIAIYVDADACPVKAEVYRVAQRYGASVLVVANSFIFVPREPNIERIVVNGAADAADDWIAERVGKGSIVVTADIPLASRAIKAGALVVAPNGRMLTDDSIGMALATRDLMSGLRELGQMTGGPKAFTPRDRSNFLSALDAAMVRLRREQGDR